MLKRLYVQFTCSEPGCIEEFNEQAVFDDNSTTRSNVDAYLVWVRKCLALMAWTADNDFQDTFCRKHCVRPEECALCDGPRGEDSVGFVCEECVRHINGGKE